MRLTFSARLSGAEILCEIGADCKIVAPVFCFSLMVPAQVLHGGEVIKSVAGYTEVALPDIPANGVVTLVLAHADPAFKITNRAWLPSGGYLRTHDGPIQLPELVLGVQPLGARPPVIETDLLKLVPQPKSWKAAGGTLAFSHVAGDAFSCIDALVGRLGLAPICGDGGVPVTHTVDPDLGAEGYRLVISARGLSVATSTAHGLFNAAISLLSLRETYHGQIPCGAIEDAPRFGWRGQHLDCARHFFAVPTLLRLLDLMALFKLNRFHWHFADDEAFRLQVDCAPDLWQNTQFRGEGERVPGVFGGGIRAGGSYSTDDVQTVLRRAAELRIEVLPEIEVPAHAFAINRALPGLRDPSDSGQEASVQAYTENILNPAMPATWDLLEPLTLEVAAQFPLGVLHLGCDELPVGAWAGSPAIDALKAEHQLAGRDDVQEWMMSRLAGHLQDHGIRPAAWEEAAKGARGGIGHESILFSWTGQGAGLEAARMGYDVVMCPAQNIYFDMAHSADPDDWGASWAAFIPLEETVNWEPVPKGAADIAHKIIGVQGCFWSEFTTQDHQMEPMLAPRILGLATKAWDQNDAVDGPSLRALSAAYAHVFDAIGWARNLTV